MPDTPSDPGPSTADAAPAADPGGSDLQVLCWNVQKINGQKCTDHGAAIVGHINSTVDTSRPYVVCILENKVRPGDVVSLLTNGLGGATDPTFRCGSLAMGGSTSTRENLIFAAGGGAAVSAEAWSDWAVPFDDDIKTTVQEYKLRKLNEFHSTGREMRRTVEQSRVASVDAVTNKTSKELRNPIALQVSGGGVSGLKMLVMHAPGPQDRTVAAEHPYAKQYVETVLQAAATAGVGLVVGDMNVYGDIEAGAYRSMTPGNVSTTQNTTDRVSRLDRVFAVPGLNAATTIEQRQISVAVSDHYSTYTRVNAAPPPVRVGPPPPVAGPSQVALGKRTRDDG